MKTITKAAALEISRRTHTKHQERAGSSLDDIIAECIINTGWAIPAAAFTDGDDQRTIENLAAWIRRYAVSEKPLGRPAEMADGKRVNVYLDAATLAHAAALGDGNVSEGIRRAIALARPSVAAA